MSSNSTFFCDRCGAANRPEARFCRACGQALGGLDTTTDTIVGLGARGISSAHAVHGTSANTLNTNVNTTFQLPIGSSTITGLLQPQHMLKQRYIILANVGKGGFGAVYKALDSQFGNRLVAVKEMSQNSLDEKDRQAAADAFQHEAMLLAGLTHPNLPRIYEQFADQGRSYLVMDYIEGETLEDRLSPLKGTTLPIEQTLDIAIQLCDVLEYLHSRTPPIIFRDLKPANVMLTPGGHIFLIDFGIARHFKPGKAKDTTALGSSGYAAPEQYGRSQTTVRADIYSLGATLHQLLTGHDPSETPFHFAPIHLPAHPALAGLADLVMHMVSVPVNERPESVAVVRASLQRIQTLYTTGAALTSPPTISTRVPPMYQAPATMPPIPAQATTTGKTGKAKGPTQYQIVKQPNTLFICTGHTGRVAAVAWSPDGKWLASASYDRTVIIWDVASGDRVWTYKGHSARVNALAWSSDSKYIASAGDDTTVQIWEPANGHLVYTYTAHSQPVNAVAWSPGGEYIASAGNDKLVLVWHAQEHSELYRYEEHKDQVYAVAWSPDGKYLASAGKEKSIRFWNPFAEQKKPRTFWQRVSSIFSADLEPSVLKVHNERVNALAWHPKEYLLASVSSDSYACIWDVSIAYKQHTKLLRTAGGNSAKNAVTWAPDGKHLAIASNDKTVQVWNVAKERCTYTYQGHQGYVAAVAWSPNGERLASAGVDRSVQIWQVV
ncbi:serine/threonine protein kinase [Ktedonobacter sp. SOSP1-52]|uniref:WD40 repeat domain-containing serine/threonine protein kinase n=1 Tax=Ktedonobacter sp. SOSP1-52 TaxID=2778366 RepID=UPI001915BC74|nr:serine/threonine-protein kinase [Ktedonobacter sp. SOSP1-52]GHO69515.1 serine/threonine protein kinase [Ktedonobacter sp. SOSP1-52]